MIMIQLGYEPNEVSTICGLTEKRAQNVTKLLTKGTLLKCPFLILATPHTSPTIPEILDNHGEDHREEIILVH